MNDEPVVIAHLSDLHFGGYADLAQIEALEEFVPSLGATAVVVSGDLTQRARHGEFQAAHAFLNRTAVAAAAAGHPRQSRRRVVEESIRDHGTEDQVRQVRLVLQSPDSGAGGPGAVIAGALSAFGVAFGSLTWNLRDLAVKGHLPASETRRVKAIFDKAPAGAAKILALHHNVLAAASRSAWGSRAGAPRTAGFWPPART